MFGVLDSRFPFLISFRPTTPRNFFQNQPFRGVMQKTPAWTETDFSQTAAEATSARMMGLYALLANDRKVYRYGEGVIQTRMKEHLKSSEHTRTTKRFTYFKLEDKGDAELIEHLLLLQYKQQNNGQLPPGNRITA